ncbi:MAG: type IV pilus biogenesis/stability protein PilW [Pseudomonadota bacterium]
MTRINLRTVALLALSVFLSGCASSGNTVNARQQQADAAAKAAQTNTQLAVGYLEKGDTELALEKIARALVQDPQSAGAHTVAGVIYERINRFDDAEKHYRQAVKLAPENGDVLNNYGQFLCKVERYQDSIPYFERAVEQPFYQNPEVALTNAGTCLEQSGKLGDAEDRYRQALEANERYPDALYMLSRALCKRGDDFRARAFLQRLQAARGDSPESLWLCYAIETRMGDTKTASDCARQLKSYFPESSQAQRLGQGNQNDEYCG